MKVKKYFKFLLIILFLNSSLAKNLYSIENKIIVKIENEIITSLDVENEINYLLASFKANSILSCPQKILLFETKLGAPKIPFS